MEALPLYINVMEYPAGAYVLVITNTDLNIIDKARFVIVRH
jgi:hypothetical protein